MGLLIPFGLALLAGMGYVSWRIHKKVQDGGAGGGAGGGGGLMGGFRSPSRRQGDVEMGNTKTSE